MLDLSSPEIILKFFRHYYSILLIEGPMISGRHITCSKLSYKRSIGIEQIQILIVCLSPRRNPLSRFSLSLVCIGKT